MARVLVIGAGGFVGSVLVRQILSDTEHHVLAIDNFDRGQCDSLIGLCKNPRFEFRRGDCSNIKDVIEYTKNVDIVINLAAKVGFPACKINPERAIAINQHAVDTLCQVIPGNVPIIQFSTGSVLGIQTEMATEESKCEPASLYGLTKLNAERILQDRGNFVALRFMTGMGISPNPRVQLLVNDFTYKALHEKIICVFEGNALRSFIDVSDMSNVAVFFMNKFLNKSKPTYTIYNVGSEKNNISKINLAKLISEKTNCLVYTHDDGVDEDKRDYECSFARLNNEGIYCNKSISDTVNELIKIYPLLHINHRFI